MRSSSKSREGFCVERSITRRLPLASGSPAGFTLVELLVALALAAMISVSIMFISSQAREAYQATVKKVDVYNRFRYVFHQIVNDFQNWVGTSDLEVFQDGRGRGAKVNQHWDPGEEVPDEKDSYGPGVVDGGIPGEFDEFAQIKQRQYISREPMSAEEKIHDAYQAYFRTRVYVDGAVRDANVEYMLVDPGKVPPGVQAIPPPPSRVEPKGVADLALYKIIRYFYVSPEMIQMTNEVPIKRKVVEVCSNVTDFRVEYLVEGAGRAEPTFRTPEDEYRNSGERITRPTRDARLGELGGYVKTFGYGSVKLSARYPRATAYPGVRADDGLAGIPDPRPMRFGFQGDPNISFAQLIAGDSIYIFTASTRAQAGAGVASTGNAGNLTRFPAGDYTVKSNVNGLLEFAEDIDTSEWGGKSQSNIYYKAAFIPAAVRITLRVVDDQGLNPKTMQRTIWLVRRSR